MANSNAERQRAYRQRHLKDLVGGGERINTVVSLTGKRGLDSRAAAQYRVVGRERGGVVAAACLACR